MTITDVQAQVEEIAQAMVILDPSDRAAMVKVGEQLLELTGYLRESGFVEAAALTENAATIASANPDQGDVPAVVIATVNQALEVLQEMLDQETPADLCVDLQLGAPFGAMAPMAEAVTADHAVASDETAAVPPSRPAGLTLSPLVDDQIIAEFLSRQSDSIGDMEKLVLSCEQQQDAAPIEALRRWFHTLKGESGLLGLTDLATICHATEDMMQAEPTSQCVDRLLAVTDWLQTCFAYLMDRGPLPADAASILALLASPPAPAVPAAPPVQAPDAAAERATEDVVDDVAEAADADASGGTDDNDGVEVDIEAGAGGGVAGELPDYSSKYVLDGDVGLLQDFIGESREHLDASEAHLLTLESDPGETEALNAVFRAFHTIKGLAGFAELDHIQQLAHRAENLLDNVRRGELDLRGQVMDLVFESVDMMKRLVEGVMTALAGSGYPQLEPQLVGLLARLHAVTSGQPLPATPLLRTAAAPQAAVSPAPAQLRQPAPAAREPEPETPAPAPAATLAGKTGFVPLSNFKRRSDGDAASSAHPAAVPARVAAQPAATAPVSDPESEEAGGPAAGAPSRGGGKAAGVKVKEAMRVDAERLDRLINTIGELVIAESMVSQSPEVRSQMTVKLARDLDHLDKISRELQEIGMSLRMMPVRPVFQKMARLARDLAKKTNRQIEFVMAGEDTELDKNVVDKIGDPLVHMVRNAIDHGLEANAAERRAAGKPEIGRVELRAFHKGGNICIEIQDDGRGLPRDKILAKAIERGLVREGDVLTDRDIHNLIFEPGFSTAAKVTDISGRGVGMDVVRRNIEELRGTCEIHSEPGRGSTFSIKLPLTLAIIEGMVIRCGTEHYIVPTLSVVRLVRPTASDISLVFDRGEMLAFEEEYLPLYRLGRLFNVSTAKADPTDAVVVVVEDEGSKIGLLADDLLGQQSIVIKSLGEAMQNTEGVAGGAIMSNGNVALILDVAGLIRAAQNASTVLRHTEELPMTTAEA